MDIRFLYGWVSNSEWSGWWSNDRYRSSLVVKDSALSLLWLKFDPGPGNFSMPWAWPKTCQVYVWLLKTLPSSLYILFCPWGWACFSSTKIYAAYFVNSMLRYFVHLLNHLSLQLRVMLFSLGDNARVYLLPFGLSFLHWNIIWSRRTLEQSCTTPLFCHWIN